MDFVKTVPSIVLLFLFAQTCLGSPEARFALVLYASTWLWTADYLDVLWKLVAVGLTMVAHVEPSQTPFVLGFLGMIFAWRRDLWPCALCGIASVVSSEQPEIVTAVAVVSAFVFLRPLDGGPLDGTVVAVGSTNPCKVDAVKATVARYGTIASINAFSVPSGVPDQPIGLDVIAAGAKHRAEAAYKATEKKKVLAFGIESGLFSLNDDLYDVCVASAYNGDTHSLGLSCAFKIPTDVKRAVLDQKMDLSQAANAAGLAADPDLGQRDGLIAILTNRRVTRKEYTIQALQMALPPVEFPNWYH